MDRGVVAVEPTADERCEDAHSVAGHIHVAAAVVAGRNDTSAEVPTAVVQAAVEVVRSPLAYCSLLATGVAGVAAASEGPRTCCSFAEAGALTGRRTSALAAEISLACRTMFDSAAAMLGQVCVQMY